MTTLVIDDKEAESIIAQYGENTIIEYIKTFSSLNSKLASLQHIDLEKEKELSLESRLKSLKILNPDGGKRLDEALEFLKENYNK